MSNKRNVLLIMCDQLRPDFLNAYGADFIPTPNIDALAADGVVFDNAITASTVCAPARMSFLTGEHVSRHDAWTNKIPVRDDCDFLPERLNAAGYMTAAVGCYDHCPFADSFGHRYMRRNIGSHAPDECDYRREFMAKHPEAKSLFERDEESYYKHPDEDFYDVWSATCAIEFIESYTKTGKAPNGFAPEEENAPFYLYCGFMEPHGPHIPPRSVKGTVDEEKIPGIILQERPDEDIPPVELYRRAYLNTPEQLAHAPETIAERMKERVRYCEMIVELDKQVGRIVQALKDNGVYENTTIIFTSDHGSVEHDYNMVSKGPWPYKAQLFIPMIIANHPELKKGTRCDALCGNLDIGATALDIAGDTRRFGLSRSMLGLATGAVPEREVNMSEFSDATKTLVDKQYTYIYYPFVNRACMFDRINDTREMTNLAGKPEYAEIEKKFLMHAIDYMVLTKGRVRIEAHDVTPEVKAGLAKKDPHWLQDFDIAHPLGSWKEVERIEQAGLDASYQEFCIGKEVKASYGEYYNTPKPEKE